MPPGLSVSVIISTRNRASALRQTLDALEKVRIPGDWKAEVTVVDVKKMLTPKQSNEA
jgi:hypothetical protein